MENTLKTSVISKEDLINFEKEIAEIFATGVIRAPIHLRSGREDQLIEIFKNIGDDDYVLGHWDSHELALLKGVPREAVKQAILEGRSISLCFPEYKVICSGIVGSLMGVAVFGTIVNMSPQFVSGIHFAFMIAGCLFLLGCIITFFCDN